MGPCSRTAEASSSLNAWAAAFRSDLVVKVVGGEAGGECGGGSGAASGGQGGGEGGEGGGQGGGCEGGSEGGGAGEHGAKAEQVEPYAAVKYEFSDQAQQMSNLFGSDKAFAC